MTGHWVALAAQARDEEPCTDEQQRSNYHYPPARRVGRAPRGATAIVCRGLTRHSFTPESLRLSPYGRSDLSAPTDDLGRSRACQEQSQTAEAHQRTVSGVGSSACARVGSTHWNDSSRICSCRHAGSYHWCGRRGG